MLVQAANYAEGTFIRANERRSMTIVPDIDVGSGMEIRGQVNIAVAVPSRRYELLVVHGTTQP